MTLLHLLICFSCRCRCRCRCVIPSCVAVIMQRHSRSRSRSRQSSPDKRPQTPEDSRVSNCGGKKRKAVWLVDQTETGQTGFWREAKWCGPHLEKQYQDGEESSDVAVVSGPGQVQYYTHTMKMGEEMRQLRFRDPERSELIFDSGLVRATMQTSRDDQSQSDPDGAEAAAGCGKGYKGVVPPTPMEEIIGQIRGFRRPLEALVVATSYCFGA